MNTELRMRKTCQDFNVRRKFNARVGLCCGKFHYIQRNMNNSLFLTKIDFDTTDNTSI